MARGCEQPSPILQRRYCVMPQHLNRVRIALTRIVLRRGNRPIFFSGVFLIERQVMAKTDTDLRPRSGRLIRMSERSGRQGSGCGAFQFLRPQQMRLRVVLQVRWQSLLVGSSRRVPRVTFKRSSPAVHRCCNAAPKPTCQLPDLAALRGCTWAIPCQHPADLRNRLSRVYDFLGRG